MGESVKTGELVEWIKKAGDAVQEDEVVCVLETDKVTVDVRSPHAGVLSKQLAGVDDVVHVGQGIAEIEVGDQAAQASGGSSEDPPPAATGATSAAADLEFPAPRQPLIHFRYGKRDEGVAAVGAAQEGVAAVGAAQASQSPQASAAAPSLTAGAIPETIVEYVDLPPLYGRLPPLSDEEALRLQLGGADP